MRPRDWKRQVNMVEAWNRTVLVGDWVEYRGYPEAEPQRYRTRTVAQMLSGHTAVVWLAGKAGCVTIEACKPVLAAEVCA